MRDIGEYNRDLFNIDRIEVLQGSVGAGVRPRLDRRRDQSGHQGRGPPASQRAVAAARHQRGASGNRRRELRGSIRKDRVPPSNCWARAARPTATRSRTTRSVLRHRFASASAPISTSSCSYEYLQTKTKTDYGQPNLGAHLRLRVCRRCRSSSTTASRTTTSRTFYTNIATAQRSPGG